jgi:hypothetical protein
MSNVFLSVDRSGRQPLERSFQCLSPTDPQYLDIPTAGHLSHFGVAASRITELSLRIWQRRLRRLVRMTPQNTVGR